MRKLTLRRNREKAAAAPPPPLAPSESNLDSKENEPVAGEGKDHLKPKADEGPKLASAPKEPYAVSQIDGKLAVVEYPLPDTVVDPMPSPVGGPQNSISLTKHPNEEDWAKVRHVSVTTAGNAVLAGKEGGTLIHVNIAMDGLAKTRSIAGGHAESVRGVSANPLWNGGEIVRGANARKS